MSQPHVRFVLPVLLLALLAACGSGAAVQDAPTGGAQAVTVFPIPLTGPLVHPDAEISGLTWFGNRLVVLPQFPGRFGRGDALVAADEVEDDGSLFLIDREALLAYIDGTRTAPVRPRPFPFSAPGLAARVAALGAEFEGYEAIVFDGDEAFVTIESHGLATRGYLVTGSVGKQGVRLIAETLTPLPVQARLDNLSYETLLNIGDDGVVAIAEANGTTVNPAPRAFAFRESGDRLWLRDTLAAPVLEYRLTDATGVDGEGRFWAMNYFYPGDRALLQPAADPFAAPGAVEDAPVERLIEFRIDGDRIVPTDRAPIHLAPRADGKPRNWEGLARLGDRGFIAVTDTYPETILAFIPYPDP